MSTENNPNPPKPGLVGYLLFIGGALFLFFITAFFVIVLRTKGNSKLVMPDLVGQNYVDVHNELSRLRLKVKLESKRFADRNDGEILYQSIAAGKKIDAGSKVYITVNIGTDKVIIPDLKGQQLVSAKALVESVSTGDTYTRLEIGGITFVPAKEGQSPETVIDQIPEPGKHTTNKEKIFLLVTEPKEGNKSSLNLEGLPFPIVAFTLDKLKKKYKLSEIIETKKPWENGLVSKAELQGDVYDLKVNYFSYDRSPYQSYEKLKLKVSNSGVYKGKLIYLDSKEPKEKEIFSNLNIESGKEADFLIYRTGSVRLDIVAENEKIEKSYKFSTDYIR